MTEQKKTENQKTVSRTRPRTWRSKHQMAKGQIDTFTVTPYEVYEYLTEELGVSDTHAAGMVANIAEESQFDPGVEGDLANKKGSAAGLFQMRLDRREGMEKFAGPYWEDNWKKQVEYMVKEDELTKTYLNTKFPDVEKATRHFTEQVERPANKIQKGKDRAKIAESFARFPAKAPKSFQETVTPTPQPTPPATVQDTIHRAPLPTGNDVKPAQPTPMANLQGTIDNNTKPIAKEDETDNTLNRTLSKSGTVAGKLGELPKGPDETPPPPPETDPVFKKADEDHDRYMEMFKQAGIGLDSDAEPRDFEYKIGERIVKSPEEFNDYVDDMTKDVYNANLTSKDRSEYLGALTTYENARKKVTDAYNRSEKQLETAQMIEILGQALAQLAAGWYGLKHGVDMSGVQFKLSDWSDNYRRIAKKLDREVETIEGREKITRQEFKDKERAAEKAAAAAEKRATRAYYTEKSDFESRESRRVSQENRLKAESRRLMVTSVVEQNRNAARDVKNAEKADNKQRQSLISSYKLKKAEAERRVKDLTRDIDNLNKAFKAGKEADIEFYLSKVLELDKETIRDISGSGWFNLEDKQDIQPLIDARKLQLETEQGIIDDAYEKIISYTEGGALPAAAGDIEAQLEENLRKQAELKKQMGQ